MIKGDKIQVNLTETGAKVPATFVRFNNGKSKMLVQVDGSLKWVNVQENPTLPEVAETFVFLDDLDNKEKLKKELSSRTTTIPRFQQVLSMWDSGNRDVQSMSDSVGATLNYVKRVLKEHRNGQK